MLRLTTTTTTWPPPPPPRDSLAGAVIFFAILSHAKPAATWITEGIMIMRTLCIVLIIIDIFCWYQLWTGNLAVVLRWRRKKEKKNVNGKVFQAANWISTTLAISVFKEIRDWKERKRKREQTQSTRYTNERRLSEAWGIFEEERKRKRKPKENGDNVRGLV